MFHDILKDVHIKRVPDSGIIDPDCGFIIMSKEDIIRYLSKEEYKRMPECFSWMAYMKETYEKMAAEEMDYLLSAAGDLSDDKEYLLVA